VFSFIPHRTSTFFWTQRGISEISPCFCYNLTFLVIFYLILVTTEQLVINEKNTSFVRFAQ